MILEDVSNIVSGIEQGEEVVHTSLTSRDVIEQIKCQYQYYSYGNKVLVKDTVIVCDDGDRNHNFQTGDVVMFDDEVGVVIDYDGYSYADVYSFSGLDIVCIDSNNLELFSGGMLFIDGGAVGMLTGALVHIRDGDIGLAIDKCIALHKRRLGIEPTHFYVQDLSEYEEADCLEAKSNVLEGHVYCTGGYDGEIPAIER